MIMAKAEATPTTVIIAEKNKIETQFYTYT